MECLDENSVGIAFAGQRNPEHAEVVSEACQWIGDESEIVALANIRRRRRRLRSRRRRHSWYRSLKKSNFNYKIQNEQAPNDLRVVFGMVGGGSVPGAIVVSGMVGGGSVPGAIVVGAVVLKR